LRRKLIFSFSITGISHKNRFFLRLDVSVVRFTPSLSFFVFFLPSW